jgi:predicted nucleotidyltransferase component of viral defense system
MIPQQAVVAWRKQAPWSVDSMVEQDLVISRALVELFNHPPISESVAFRGGTALYKLHMLPSARYSEDIDLVQIRAEPIGETLDLIRRLLDAWLGTPKRVLKEGRVNLLYRFTSEDVSPVPMRLKIEINTREHFAELGYHSVPFSVQSQWFSGDAQITTFDFNELLGTKLRALYQRKKGRDLFDCGWRSRAENCSQNDCFSALTATWPTAGTRFPAPNLNRISTKNPNGRIFAPT